MGWSACDCCENQGRTRRGGLGVTGSIREVGDGEKGVLVEDLAVQEPLEEVPRHWYLKAPGEAGGGVRGGFGI